jgi:hypothetical protein
VKNLERGVGRLPSWLVITSLRRFEVFHWTPLQELADQRRKMAGNDADRSLSDLERQGLGQQLINELRLKTGQAKAEGSIRHFMDLLEAGRPPLILAQPEFAETEFV